MRHYLRLLVDQDQIEQVAKRLARMFLDTDAGVLELPKNENYERCWQLGPGKGLIEADNESDRHSSEQWYRLHLTGLPCPSSGDSNVDIRSLASVISSIVVEAEPVYKYKQRADNY